MLIGLLRGGSYAPRSELIIDRSQRKMIESETDSLEIQGSQVATIGTMGPHGHPATFTI